jgi:hypothetical protein
MRYGVFLSPDHSTILGDHHEAILVQSGALMDWQQGFQVAYLTTILSNQFSKNIWINSKYMEF